MSMTCLYLLGKCNCSFRKQFPKSQFDLQRKQKTLNVGDLALLTCLYIEKKPTGKLYIMETNFPILNCPRV